MIRRSTLLIVALCALLRAEEAPLSEGFDADYQACLDAQDRYVAAIRSAREEGLIVKGKPWPEEVTKLRDGAAHRRGAFYRKFEKKVLPARGWFLLGRLHAMDREYEQAADCYERATGADGEIDPETLQRLSMAALNAKQPERAAKWMGVLIELEREVEPDKRRGEWIRTIYYPRTLITLGRFEELERYAFALSLEEETPRSLEAGLQFLFIAFLNRSGVKEALGILETIEEHPDRLKNLRGWAVQARLALLAAAGRYGEQRKLLDAYLESKPEGEVSAPERNARRRLETIGRFLGKPAPALVVNTWIGAKDPPAGDPLAAWRSDVVLLDFWQPWCEPCRNAMPELVVMQAAFQGFRVLGLCRVEDYGYDVAKKEAVRPVAAADYPAHVRKFRKDMQLNYPLAIAGGRQNSKAYGVRGIPTLVLIDRQGVVRYMSVGAGEKGLLQLAVAGVVSRR